MRRQMIKKRNLLLFYLKKIEDERMKYIKQYILPEKMDKKWVFREKSSFLFLCQKPFQ